MNHRVGPCPDFFKFPNSHEIESLDGDWPAKGSGGLGIAPGYPEGPGNELEK